MDTNKQLEEFYRNVVLDEDIVKEIDQIVNIEKRKKYKEWGLEASNGLLLYGPPGTGKTTMAKQIAKLNGYGFLHESASRFVEKYVGVGPQKINKLYGKAKKMSKEKDHCPVIVFIDEIDAIGAKRNEESNKEIMNTLNQLLIEMDGFDSDPNIITIVATNRYDILDDALLRSGRFDKQIEIGLPKQKEREMLWKLFGSKIKKKSKLPYRKLAEESEGLSGADIELIVKEAAMKAIDEEKNKMTPSDIYTILEKKKGKSKSDKQIGFVIANAGNE